MFVRFLLIDPPQIHRHRYYGVLAPQFTFSHLSHPNSRAVTGSLANGTIEVEVSSKNDDETEQNTENTTKRPPKRYLWMKQLNHLYYQNPGEHYDTFTIL